MVGSTKSPGQRRGVVVSVTNNASQDGCLAVLTLHRVHAGHISASLSAESRIFNWVGLYIVNPTPW